MTNSSTGGAPGSVLAVSDLHVGHRDNRTVLDSLRPESSRDWLIVAGDVGELAVHVEWALRRLAERFERVIWTPGNHELWTVPSDPVQLRGDHRYRYLVDLCRRIGVLTPEDPYPVWQGPAGPVVVAPLFCLYDYSFLPAGARSKAEALAAAYTSGVVCTDEYLLHPDPHPSREAWCAELVATAEARLAEVDPRLPVVLVNHFPLTREPTRILRHPEFALWCGTERTGDWHRRFNVAGVVYGHLHIPRVTYSDGVRFDEVSLGYPKERQRRGSAFELRRILPQPPA